MTLEDIPIIKLFMCNGRYYLYDCYKNRVLCITKQLFSEINELNKLGVQRYIDSNRNTTEYDAIISLIQKGYFKSNFIKRIEHPETFIVKHIIDRCLNDITLQVTRNCNFSCRYCMFSNCNGLSRVHENVDMTWDVAKNAIDFLYEHSKDAQEITIAFYGGEPMLNYSVIKKVVLYAKTKFFTKRVRYLMTTNCSIMPDDAIDFFIEHDFELTVSFDGPESIQNKHRRLRNNGDHTFEIVQKNVCKIKSRSKEYFQTNITFLPVFFEDEDYNLIGQFFDDLGVEGDKIHKVLADLKGIDYSLNRGTLISREQLNLVENNRNIDIQYTNIYNNKTELPSVWHHNGPCIPAMQRLFVNVAGTFHMCEKSMEDEHLSIGSLESGIDFDRVRRFMNIGKLTESQCKNCWAMRYCNICLMFCNDVEKKQISKDKKLLACKQIKDDVLAFFKKQLSQTDLEN